MAAQKATQFNYILDSKSGLEYWITGYYSSELGEAPGLVEKKPYGTLLLEWLDMDISLISAIGDTLGRFAQVDSPEAYVRRWPDFKDDIWKMESITEQLPILFSDLCTILSFYISEYMTDPATREHFGRAEIDRMVRGAQIIQEHCEKIQERHALLHALIAAGKLSGTKKGARRALEGLEPEALQALMDCNVQAHYILLEKDGREQIDLCFDAGVDLTAFLSVALTDILGGQMEIALCQHCGKPFITGGRAIYCDRRIPGGGTCRTVGALNKYHKSLEENPAVGRYRRAYKRHYARMMKGTYSREDFTIWRDTAKETLGAFLAGTVSEAQLDKALESDY